MAQAAPGPYPQWCPGEFWDPLWGFNPDGLSCPDGFPGWDRGGYDHGGPSHDDGHHDDGHGGWH